MNYKSRKQRLSEDFTTKLRKENEELKKKLETKDKTIKNHAGVIQRFTKSLETKNKKFDDLQKAYLEAINELVSIEEMSKHISLYEKIAGKSFKEAVSKRSCS
jgi:GTP1/Obg family GTP-binding protein